MTFYHYSFKQNYISLNCCNYCYSPYYCNHCYILFVEVHYSHHYHHKQHCCCCSHHCHHNCCCFSFCHYFIVFPSHVVFPNHVVSLVVVFVDFLFLLKNFLFLFVILPFIFILILLIDLFLLIFFPSLSWLIVHVFSFHFQLIALLFSFQLLLSF